MFTFRQAHQDAFQENAIAPSRRRLIATLKDSLPEDTQNLTTAELNYVCNQAIEIANRTDIERERNVCFLAGAIILLGNKLKTGECNHFFNYILYNDVFDEDMKGFFILKGIIQFSEKEDIKDG